MENTFSMAWETHVEPTRITRISSDHIHDHPGQGSHILAFTDSYRALGWMHKASFDPVNAESHDAVSPLPGWTMESNRTSLYSQHIKGTENIIADSLLRDFHRSDQTLTKNSNQILQPQTAASFQIKHPSRNVISWI